MSAPDLETIYDIEEAVEAACKAVMAGYGIKAYMQRESDDLPKERVDIQLQVAAPSGHLGKMAPGQFVRDAWNGILTFSIFTRRLQNNGDGKPEPVPRGTHGKMRARVRIACEYFSAKFTPELLPYHVLTSIAQAGTDPEFRVDDDLDVSAIHFNVLISVRDGAWPVV